MTWAEAAQRHGCRLRRFGSGGIGSSSRQVESQMPGVALRAGSQSERRLWAEAVQLKLALAETTVQLRIWHKMPSALMRFPSGLEAPRTRAVMSVSRFLPWPAAASAPTAAAWRASVLVPERKGHAGVASPDAAIMGADGAGCRLRPRCALRAGESCCCRAATGPTAARGRGRGA